MDNLYKPWLAIEVAQAITGEPPPGYHGGMAKGALLTYATSRNLSMYIKMYILLSISYGWHFQKKWQGTRKDHLGISEGKAYGLSRKLIRVRRCSIL